MLLIEDVTKSEVIELFAFYNSQQRAVLQP
jgi:hypothetical protein